MKSSPKSLNVMTLDQMGTVENLHNSLFQNMSIAKTSAKHKALVLAAQATVNTELHPFVKQERARLAAKKHLKGVDKLTEGLNLPKALKHHHTFAQVRGWILTENQSRERMAKLQPNVTSSLPKCCTEYKQLRDRNRFLAMNENQRRWDKRRQQKGFKEANVEGVDKFDHYDSNTPFGYLHKAKENDDCSKTGLRAGDRNPQTVVRNEILKREIARMNDLQGKGRRRRRQRPATAESLLWRDGGNEVGRPQIEEGGRRGVKKATSVTNATNVTNLLNLAKSILGDDDW